MKPPTSTSNSKVKLRVKVRIISAVGVRPKRFAKRIRKNKV